MKYLWKIHLDFIEELSLLFFFVWRCTKANWWFSKSSALLYIPLTNSLECDMITLFYWCTKRVSIYRKIILWPFMCDTHRKSDHGEMSCAQHVYHEVFSRTTPCCVLNICMLKCIIIYVSLSYAFILKKYFWTKF